MPYVASWLVVHGDLRSATCTCIELVTLSASTPASCQLIAMLSLKQQGYTRTLPPRTLPTSLCYCAADRTARSAGAVPAVPGCHIPRHLDACHGWSGSLCLHLVVSHIHILLLFELHSRPEPLLCWPIHAFECFNTHLHMPCAQPALSSRPRTSAALHGDCLQQARLQTHTCIALPDNLHPHAVMYTSLLKSYPTCTLNPDD